MNKIGLVKFVRTDLKDGTSRLLKPIKASDNRNYAISLGNLTVVNSA